jgi:NhaP-type Na+/H+ or K+/H+ antiporter
VLGTTFGISLGPHVLGIFDPRSWTGVTDLLTREFTRIVLATGLFAIGVRLPARYMAKHAKSLLIMVVPTMAFGWLVSAGERVSAVTNSTHLLPTFLLSASIYTYPFPKARFCVRARDLGMLNSHRPNCQRCHYRSVAETIDSIVLTVRLFVEGKFAVENVPSPIRNVLEAESASNDGLAYPFLSISIYLTTEASLATAFEKWLVIGWLCTWMIRVFLLLALIPRE